MYAEDLNGTSAKATSEVAFSPNNDYLVIQFKGLPTVAVIVFPISANGTLGSPMVYPPSAPLGAKSFGFNIYPGNWVVTTDAALGVLLYQIGSTGVVNTSRVGISPAGTQAYCWITWDNMTNHGYAIAAHTGNITEVGVGSKILNEVVTLQTPWIPLTDAATLPLVDGVHGLFVLSPGNGIGQWNITGPGALKQVGATAFPKLDTTNVSGLASYSVWNYTASHSAAVWVRPSMVLFALLFLVNILY